jgi:ribonuclease H2 subunit B
MFSPDFKKRTNFATAYHKCRIFIMQDNNEENASGAIAFVTLPLPAKDVAAKFIIKNKYLLEIQRMADEPCSWFVDDTVEKDGALYIATQVDPLLIALPFLENSRNKKPGHKGYFIEADQILVSDTHPDIRKLYGVKGFILESICDTQIVADKKVVRLNDDLVLNWLRQKVLSLKNVLSRDLALVSTNAAAVSTFIRAGNNQGPSEDEVLKTAIGFLSEYIPLKWLSDVASAFGITSVDSIMTPSQQPTIVLPATTRDTTHQDDANKRTPNKKPAVSQPTTQQKRLASAAKGSASISAFFAAQKKPKVE